MASTRGVAKVAYFASATDATVNSSASDWSRSRSESSPTGPSSATVSSSDTRSSASKFPVAEALFSGGRQGAEYPGLGKDAGWGLEVLSLQRDWAHVEWRADALVPDGSENGADPRTCPSEVGAQDAFELRAAVVTQVCPRGAVGVAGVDLRPLDGGGGSNSSSSGGHEVVRRFACVDTVLPMTESIHGDTHRIYEGRPRALSNLLFDEGGASDQQDGGAVDGEPSRWMWRGPQPPSVTYALDMSGRELGASVEIRLTVNSSVSARDASRSALDSPSAWRMGPYSAAASDDAGPGCVAGNGTLPPLEETSFNLTVAVRAGALPELDANGSAGEDTWVLRTSDVLREAVELAPCPSPLGGEYDREPKKSADASSSMELRGVSSAAAVSEDGTRRWSTVFKWNVTRPPPLRPAASGGSGIEKGDLATTLFVVIYADIGDKAGEEAGKEGSGVDDEDPLWALGVAPRVAFRYCTEDVCPADRGWCRPTLTSSGSDDYVTISKCHCFYGYGGESCSQRAVSLLSLVWKFVCLVCSNLAVIPGVRVALRLGMATGAAPALVLSLNGIASALYHMCDLELTCAAGLLTYSSLQALDFFFSLFSVAALVLHLCPMPWDEPLVPHPIPTSSTTAGVAAVEGESGGGRVLGDDAPAHGGCRPEEDESEDRVGGGQEEGEKKEGGTRLAALYACLTYPLLAAVTNGPTAGANLIAMFAICGALLVFSWGRLVARDSRGWWKEALAKLDEERVDGDAEGIDGAGARGLEHGPPLDGAGEAVHAPAWRDPNALDTREDGQRGRRGRSRDRNVGVVKRRNSSSPRRNAPLSDHGGTGGTGHGSPVGDLTEESFLIPLGDSSRVPDNSFGNSGGERSVEPSCLGPARVGRVRGVLRSLRRVTVDRGLLDWRQLGFGVAGFALGLTCFALEGAPATVKSYHLWHGAWHVLAMGSTVPLLRARRWGVVETLGGDDFYGRRYGAPVRLGWRARLHVCVRGCRVPNENRTYEMVPDRQPRDLPRRSER